METTRYNVIGIMSGTSLDGLDIAYCTFEEQNEGWIYDIEIAETIPYSEEWKYRLQNTENALAFEFVKTDADYGVLIGNSVKNFIKKHQCCPQLIASHGHTIFHRPELGFSTQIGNGNAIHAITGIPTIFDFRSLDIALGGQGAPLVPIGDQLLFSKYDFCLNLGGIANISYQENNKRIAFDISPCNMALNYLSGLLGLEYDAFGENAKKGKLCRKLLEELNSLAYYQTSAPKSLGKEWFLEYFFPPIEKSSVSTYDKLRTVAEHITFQIAEKLKNLERGNLVITGGGALNRFLIELLSEKITHRIEVPHPLIVNYKEALIFAFLGVLRLRGKYNCLSSVTGAQVSCSGGILVGI